MAVLKHYALVAAAAAALTAAPGTAAEAATSSTVDPRISSDGGILSLDAQDVTMIRRSAGGAILGAEAVATAPMLRRVARQAQEAQNESSTDRDAISDAIVGGFEAVAATCDGHPSFGDQFINVYVASEKIISDVTGLYECVFNVKYGGDHKDKAFATPLSFTGAALSKEGQCNLPEFGAADVKSESFEATLAVRFAGRMLPYFGAEQGPTIKFEVRPDPHLAPAAFCPACSCRESPGGGGGMFVGCAIAAGGYRLGSPPPPSPMLV